MIRFILNDQNIETNENPGTTVLDFIRYNKHLVGTKIGCREGDCGACTVIIGKLVNGRLHYESMTSCLMPLANVNGKHVVTIEGLNMDQLTPVQLSFAKHNASQCGFCTVGFVNSLSSYLFSHDEDKTAIKAIDGNICRCTGYKSIENVCFDIENQLKHNDSENQIDWLIENNFIPEYFSTITERIRILSANISKISVKDSAKAVAGGTDIYVQMHDRITEGYFQYLDSQPELKIIYESDGMVHLGSMVTISDLMNSQIVQEIIPQFNSFMKLVSSTPIRNMATIGGNIVNASPIGDLTILFLALNAKLELQNDSSTRVVEMKDFFKDYKVLDLQNGEILKKIFFEKPKGRYYFNFEKVSKRTHLDIASVNSACLLVLNDKNKLSDIHISAGGVGPVPKYLDRTSSFLIGKPINEKSIRDCLNLIESEISPISDIRGSKEYKMQLLRNLILCHFKVFSNQLNIKNLALSE